MTENAAVRALKGRRRRAGAARPTPEEMVAERPPGTPPMRRRQPFLFDPAEMPIVIEIGGTVPMSDFDQYYIRAEFDATEQIVPDGCVTPVSRTLWRVGQHVRRDVYATWLRDNGPDDESGEDEKESGEDG